MTGEEAMTVCLYDGNWVSLKACTKEMLEEALYDKYEKDEIRSEDTVKMLLNGYSTDDNAIYFPYEINADDLMEAATAIAEYVAPESRLECYESLNSGNFWRLCFDGKNVEEICPDLAGVYDEHPFEKVYPALDTSIEVMVSTPEELKKNSEMNVYFPIKGIPDRYVDRIFISDGKICGGMVTGPGRQAYGFSVSKGGTVILSLPPDAVEPNLEKALAKTLKPFLAAINPEIKRDLKNKKKKAR